MNMGLSPEAIRDGQGLAVYEGKLVHVSREGDKEVVRNEFGGVIEKFPVSSDKPGDDGEFVEQG